MATNQYGQTYVGNDDFRGWLAAGNYNGDKMLDYVGNDGRVDWDKANSGQYNSNTRKINSGMAGDAGWDAQQLYNIWNSERQNGTGNSNTGQSTVPPAGGGSGTTRDYAAERLYQSGIDQTNNLISQLGSREQSALNSLLASYNNAKARQETAYGDYESDYKNNVDKLARENEAKKTKIDTSVRNDISSLQRLLAARGAGSSSAYGELVPGAVAARGTSDRADANQTYTDNLDNQNTNWNRYKREYDQNMADMATDYENNRKSTQSQFAEQGISARQKLAELQANLANARGGGQAAINAATAQTNAINDLQNRITELANRAAGTTINAKDAKYTAADNKAYNDGANNTTAQAVVHETY